jgi:hypothetical protein
MLNKASRLVVAIYEDELTRKAALRFFESLVAEFWSRCDFAVEWFSFDSLGGTSPDQNAVLKTVEADLIVFVAHPEGELPTGVVRWMDAWCEQRNEREGSVIGLLDPAKDGGAQANRYTWLRYMAHKAGMDYLTQAPQQISLMPETADPFLQRAAASSSTLEEILEVSKSASRVGEQPLGVQVAI